METNDAKHVFVDGSGHEVDLQEDVGVKNETEYRVTMTTVYKADGGQVVFKHWVAR